MALSKKAYVHLTYLSCLFGSREIFWSFLLALKDCFCIDCGGVVAPPPVADPVLAPFSPPSTEHQNKAESAHPRCQLVSSTLLSLVSYDS